MKKLGLILVVLAMVLTMAACGGSSSGSRPVSSPSSPKENAWYACTLFIKRQYSISGLQAERYRPDKVVKSGGLYAVDVFYPDRDQAFGCILTKTADGWGLVDLSRY